MTRQEAREFVKSFVKLRSLATDEVSLQVPNLYPAWKTDVQYSVGERVLYDGVLYKVLLSHFSQEDWTPVSAPSLFAKVLIPDENVIYPWEQPDSTNPYMKGDKVLYNGKTYVSAIDNNIWSPESYPAGWEEI